MANFSLYLPKLLRHEGGFVNDPVDPGGATNKGITIATYRKYKPSASVQDLQNITDAEVKHIYKVGYWDALKLDRFSSQNLAEIVADHGVNAGVSRAAKMLQYLLNQMGQNVAVDGIVGEKTLAALGRVNQDALYNKFIALRTKYYSYRAAQLSTNDADTLFFSSDLGVSPASSQSKFYRGWIARVNSFPKIAMGVSAGVLLLAGLGLFFF